MHFPDFFSANEFGSKVVFTDEATGVRTLLGEGTEHGTQMRGSLEPRDYYTRSGPVGDIFGTLPAALGGEPIGVVGLGIGVIAAYVRPGQPISFFEIDPGVVEIAKNPRLFSFLDRCAGPCEVETGDGLALLQQPPHQRFGVLMLDAYTGGTVPGHLLGAEAVDAYLAQVRPGGALVFHVTQNTLHLETRVMDDLAPHDLVAFARVDDRPEQGSPDGRKQSHYLVAARSLADLGDLPTREHWRPARGS